MYSDTPILVIGTSPYFLVLMVRTNTSISGPTMKKQLVRGDVLMVTAVATAEEAGVTEVPAECRKQPRYFW